jgi:molybdopterin synthase catalytic subunit/molybdopterin converting factor small subunit
MSFLRSGLPRSRKRRFRMGRLVLKVKVKLYAVLAELAGGREFELDCGKPRCSVREVLGRLWDTRRLASVFPGFEGLLVLDSNGKRLGLDDIVEDGVIEVLPPSAGGEKVYVRVASGSESFSLDDLLDILDSGDETGATIFFVGTVRRVNRGGVVSELQYEAHEKLREKLEEIAGEVLDKYGLDSVGLIHYVGVRKPGDVTFIAVVRGKSRGPCFEAIRELVERVKHEAPIWKREVRSDGVYWLTGDKMIRVS